MRYTITAQTPAGPKFMGRFERPNAKAIKAEVRDLKRRMPEWSFTAYRIVLSRNVEMPIYTTR